MTKQQSFLQVDPRDKLYADVEYILLDPSCSGSGIVNRFDALVDQQPEHQVDAEQSQTEQAARLDNLAEFQECAIAHAMTCTPTII